MTYVEDRYRTLILGLSPHERVARSAAMACWARELIAREIQKQRGPLPAERLKWEVALRLYGSQPLLRALIAEKLARVSD